MNDNENKDSDLRNYRNRIIFGAPGTGKSFKLNKDSEVIKGEVQDISERIKKFYDEAKKLNSETNSSYKLIKLGFENADIFFNLFSQFGKHDKMAEELKLFNDKGNLAVGSLSYLHWGADLAKEKNNIPTNLHWGADLAKEKNNIPTKNKIERVTFHPNYSYAQFVGSYKPISKSVKREENGKQIEFNEISYEYVPGPFIKTWIKAYKSGQPQLLIIEEINRANVAAVFGDTFQLLDRDSKGESEYPITISNDLKRYLSDKEGINIDTMTIPNNMYIWATMNSADQGVFPMDAAFKRRWDFEYLPIDDENIKNALFDEKDEAIKELKDFINNGYNDPESIKGLLRDKNPNISDETIAGLIKLLSWKVAFKTDTYNWYLLRKEINKLLKEKVDWINEDKLLGPWFIKPDGDDEITISSKNFCNKVLMYLYEDVVKIDPSKIFKKKDGKGQIFYSEVAKNWETDGLNIFDGLEKIYESYSPKTGDKK